VIDAAGVAPDWAPLVQSFRDSEQGSRLMEFLAHRRAAGADIFPPQPLRALALTPLNRVRVIIIGQDPYHGAGQANGLAFSVSSGVPIPPSLRNIFLELKRDLGCAQPETGTLDHWADDGVLLLNVVCTVERARPGSHAGQGWESLTLRLIAALNADRRPKVFMLWGAYAQGAGKGIVEPHLVLTANHPSPLSARRPPNPFLGCGHFSRANAFLSRQGFSTIHWC